MARVTVEDCLKNVRNRFELVIVAAKRARQLMRGKEPKVDWDNDKATVVALREIAAGYTNIDTTEDHAPEPATSATSFHHTPAAMAAHDHDDDKDDEDEILPVETEEEAEQRAKSAHDGE